MVTVKMSPIVRDFDNWAHTGTKAQTRPLNALKDLVIGIDANYFLSKLLTTDLKEPLVPALGGFPFCFTSVVERELDALKRADITPVFVFSGCSIPRKEKPFTVPDESFQARSHAWSLYDKGLGDEAVAAFGETGIIQPTELYRLFQDLLHKNDVDFQVAPYAAWPQLAHLQKKSVVDAIYGDYELFLFDVDKVIISLNLLNSSITWISKERMLSEIRDINNEQFIDAFILSGSHFCRPYPTLEGRPFSEALNLMKRYGSAANMLKAQPEQHPGYLDKYRRTRAAIKHHVILHDNGVVEPMLYSEAPNDVHEFMGQRLPEELYFYLSRGIIGPQILDMLATGELEQAPPLDSGEDPEYRKLLSGLNTMRTESLSLLAKSLHRYWMNKEVKVYNWYDSKNPKVLVHKDIPHPSELAQKWNVREEIYQTEIPKYEPFQELAFTILSLQTPEFAAKSLIPKNPEKLLTTNEEIRVNTLWRMLQMRGFIDGPTHALTVWGRAYLAALNICTWEDDGIVEALYIAFELFRMKALKPENFAPGLSGAPVRGSEKDNKNIILVSQVASLLPLAHETIGYSGPLSRHMLAFNSFTRSLQRELRNFVEMTLVNLLMAGDADRDNREDWSELGLRLPFINEVNSCLGIATKTYLEELCGTESNPTSPEARRRQKERLPDMFSHAKSVIDDVEWAFMFWAAVRAGVKVLEKENVMPTEVKAFLEADEWLEMRL